MSMRSSSSARRNIPSTRAWTGPIAAATSASPTTTARRRPGARDVASGALARRELGDEIVQAGGEALEHRKVEAIDRDECADLARRRQYHVGHEPGDAAALGHDQRAVVLGQRHDPA